MIMGGGAKVHWGRVQWSVVMKRLQLLLRVTTGKHSTLIHRRHATASGDVLRSKVIEDTQHSCNQSRIGMCVRVYVCVCMCVCVHLIIPG